MKNDYGIQKYENNKDKCDKSNNFYDIDLDLNWFHPNSYKICDTNKTKNSCYQKLYIVYTKL